MRQLYFFFKVKANECRSQYCNSCVRVFEEGRDSTVYQCPDCQNIFCCECDLFFHEILHSCSGCISMSEKLSSVTSKNNVGSERDKMSHNGSNGTRKIVTTNGMSWLLWEYFWSTKILSRITDHFIYSNFVLSLYY